MAILLNSAPLAVWVFGCLCGLVIPAIIVVNLLRRLTSTCGLSKDVPWAGVSGKGDAWSRLKANLRSVLHLRGLIDEGYTKVSLHVDLTKSSFAI